MSGMGSTNALGHVIRRITGPARTAWGHLQAVDGSRGSLTRALVASVALAVIAGSTAGAVTLVTQSVSFSSGVIDEDDASAAPSDDDVEGDAVDATDGDTPSDDGGSEATDASDDSSGAEGAADADGGEADELPLTFTQTVAQHGAPDYSAILTRRYPGAQWSLNGNDPSGLRWFGPGDVPTPAELDAHWPSVASEIAAQRAEQETAQTAAADAREIELTARRADPDTQALLDSFDPRSIWGSSPDYAAILTRRFPGAEWSLNGNDAANGLVWHSGSAQPTKAELDAAWAEVAREMALEMDPQELERWAGTGEEIYVEGVLRPAGWVGGANDAQPAPVATPKNLQHLPQIASTNNGSPVGSLNVAKDPTGGQNFEQRYGLQLHELAARIAEAHGYFGGSHSLGLGMNGDRELMWYSDQVDPAIVERVLADLGAVPEPEPTPEPEPEPEPEPAPEPDDSAPADEAAPDPVEGDAIEG